MGMFAADFYDAAVGGVRFFATGVTNIHPAPRVLCVVSSFPAIDERLVFTLAAAL